MQIIGHYAAYMQKSLDVEVRILDAEEGDEKVKAACLPLKPVCVFA